MVESQEGTQELSSVSSPPTLIGKLAVYQRLDRLDRIRCLYFEEQNVMFFVTDSGWEIQISSPAHVLAIMNNLIIGSGEIDNQWYRDYGWRKQV